MMTPEQIEEAKRLRAAIIAFKRRLGLGPDDVILDQHDRPMVVVMADDQSAFVNYVNNMAEVPLRFTFEELQWLIRQHARKQQQLEQLEGQHEDNR